MNKMLHEQLVDIIDDLLEGTSQFGRVLSHTVVSAGSILVKDAGVYGPSGRSSSIFVGTWHEVSDGIGDEYYFVTDYTVKPPVTRFIKPYSQIPTVYELEGALCRTAQGFHGPHAGLDRKAIPLFEEGSLIRSYTAPASALVCAMVELIQDPKGLNPKLAEEFV